MTGGAVGALVRWLVSNALNSSKSGVQLGTLAVNLIGSFLIGAITKYLSSLPGASPEVRLIVVTGFLGALTTFSTFSLETVALIKNGQLASACAMILLHLVGALLATLLGIEAVSRIIGSRS